MGEGAETMQSRGGGSKIFRNEGDHPKSGGLFLKWEVLTPLQNMERYCLFSQGSNGADKNEFVSQFT